MSHLLPPTIDHGGSLVTADRISSPTSSDPLAKGAQAWEPDQSNDHAFKILSLRTWTYKSNKEVEKFLSDCIQSSDNGTLIFPFGSPPLQKQEHLVSPAEEWQHIPAPELDLKPIIHTSPDQGITLIVVPTENKTKMKVVFDFVQLMEEEGSSRHTAIKRNPFRIIGRKAESEAGEQPYTHQGGLNGCFGRIKNVHATILDEYQAYQRAPSQDSCFHNVTKIKFISFENHIQVRDNDLAFDHPALAIYDDATGVHRHSIGRGVLVTPYYLHFAQACHYERLAGSTDGQIEDLTKGLLTVGKAINLLTRGKIKSDDWHENVCGKSRYEIIQEDLMDVWRASSDIML